MSFEHSFSPLIFKIAHLNCGINGNILCQSILTSQHVVILNVLDGNMKDNVTTNLGYSDVVVQNSKVYAARGATPHTVEVYNISTWGREQKISTPCCSAEVYSLHRLHVTDDSIMFSCYDKDKLHVLNHSGELLHTSGYPISEATEDADIETTESDDPVPYGPGVLHGPNLCQVDAEGSALVADKYNHRLQVMKADGTWNIVDLDHTEICPKAAVWCRGSLYVANRDKIVRLSVIKNNQHKSETFIRF